MSTPELKFIAGDFFDCVIPEGKEYLFPYFRSPMQRCFLAYYLQFGEIIRFIDHSGYYCSERWLKFLKKKADILQTAYDKARLDLDANTISVIKSGRYKIKLRNRKPNKKIDSSNPGDA